MNTPQVLSTTKTASALAEGICRGFVAALSGADREPREWIVGAIRLGMCDAVTRMFEGYSIEDVLDALKAGVGNRK